MLVVGGGIGGMFVTQLEQAPEVGGQHYDPTGWDAAAAAFVAERAPQTAQVQRRPRLWGDSWHLDGVARLVRNELFRRRDPDDYRCTDWAYAEQSA